MPYLYPLLAILIWAGNTVVNKAATQSIFPAEIGFYRWLFAALLLTPFCLPFVWKNRHTIKPWLGKIIVLGILGMAVYQSLAYFAASHTSATNMGIILALMPLISLVLSMLVLGTQLTWGALLGCALSLIGVLTILAQGNWSQLWQHGINSGDAMMLLATFAYAVYSVLLKRWRINLPTFQLLYLQVLVAIIVLFPLFLHSEKAGLNHQNLPLVLYAFLFASIAAPWAWIKAVSLLGPSRTSLFFNWVPLFTALIAMWALGEIPGVYHAVGGVLTLLGVILAEQWKTPIRT